ncbi:hypothetical protein AU255_14930 [Methyloprofundus sedimenti]|uniref:histidine kinase n=1 Tax=Methyloprofundus sedimenti TaxID=1420851 RepID=A0A1V8M1T1_9GAMM|nr:nitrogen fixation negative regulator NifL [Methyloprofundus sedimenti]OQK15519.1 hypothetical protein AU255_14930 [Methyloprofundus sedimenti]
MKNKSPEYLQLHTKIQDNINDLNHGMQIPEENKSQHMRKNAHNNNALPAWFFEEAVKQAPLAISITDKKANIVYANAAFCLITGYSIDEVIGKNESILSNKSTPRAVYHDLWRTISRNNIWQGQLVNRHKNGTPYLAELMITPIRDSLKNVTHYLGMHRDVSPSFKIEKKLQNQRHFSESVINASPIAMAVLNKDNAVVLDNFQYKKLLSSVSDKEPAHLFMELLSHELGDIWAYLHDNPDGFSDIEIRIDNTTLQPLWFSCSGRIFQEKETDPESFFNENHNDYLLLNLANITKQRQAQEAFHFQTLKALTAEEEQIRSIRETLLGAIHQVSQPLNQIQAAIQIMENKEGQEPLLNLLKELGRSGQNTLATLNNCVPSIVPTTASSINLNQITHEVLMMSNLNFLSNGIIIEWNPSTILPNILGSDNKLRTLFKMLIDNATNALTHNTNQERLIKINSYYNNNQVIVSIADTGPGIAKENQAKIFLPFFTTKSNGSMQAGMGLVVAKEIAHQFNGTLTLDTDYTEGCRFIVSFPELKHDNESGATG